MRTITFSENWNGKLDNQYFTTIRPAEYEYISDRKVEVERPDGTKFKALVVSKKDKKYKNLSGWISRLDAGMNVQELYDLLKNFYKNKEWWNGTSTEFSVLLLKNLEVEE